MAPMKATHSISLSMRPAGFLLPALAALALASCAAPPPPPSPPPTASVPPSAPQQLAPPSPPPPPAAPAAQSPAPFVTPGEMSLSGPPSGASPSSRLNSPPQPVEPPVNKNVADALNNADTDQRREYAPGDGCSSVRWAITYANNEPTPTAQRAEVKRYADRCKLRFQP